MTASTGYRSVIVALAAALATALAFVVLRPAAAAPIVQQRAGLGACVTDGSGFCVVAHDLGAAPAGVLVTPRGPAAGNAINGAMTADVYTATTFRVRAWRPSGTNLVNTSITFAWLAFRTQTAVPTQSPPGSPRPPSVSPTPPTEPTAEPTNPTTESPGPAPSATGARSD